MMDKEFWELMSLGLRRSTSLILDGLGIYKSMAEMESWPEYAAARKAFFGMGRLGRFWCGRIRPWLRPKRHRALEGHFKEMQVIFQEEYLAAVLEEIGD